LVRSAGRTAATTAAPASLVGSGSSRFVDHEDAKLYRERRATCIELLLRLGVVKMVDEDDDGRP
jgi:hypothetical protein